MKRFSILLAAWLALLPAAAPAQTQGNPCNLSVRVNAAAASATVLNGNSANSIRICFYTISLNATASSTAQLVWGTGTTCGTNQVTISAQLAQPLTPANSVQIAAGDGSGFIDENPQRGISNLCLIASGSSPSIYATIRYALV
jgi:hypothetical protein